MAAAFNGHDLETGSVFSKDDSSIVPEDERFRKRFRRRVKVWDIDACDHSHAPREGLDASSSLLLCSRPPVLTHIYPIAGQLVGLLRLLLLPDLVRLLPVGAHHQDAGPGLLRSVRHRVPVRRDPRRADHHPVR